MTDYTPKDVERFWSKVDLSKADEDFACWEWTAFQLIEGYGTIGWGKKVCRSHRVAYEIAFGEYPDTLHVLHHCDNPACVNPNHLFLGTNSDNIRDKVAKGRAQHLYGEQHGKHKLTNEQVAEIRQRYAQGGVSYRQLAEEYGVDHSQIGNIVKRKQRSL